MVKYVVGGTLCLLLGILFCIQAATASHFYGGDAFPTTEEDWEQMKATPLTRGMFFACGLIFIVVAAFLFKKLY